MDSPSSYSILDLWCSWGLRFDYLKQPCVSSMHLWLALSLFGSLQGFGCIVRTNANRLNALEQVFLFLKSICKSKREDNLVHTFPITWADTVQREFDKATKIMRVDSSFNILGSESWSCRHDLVYFHNRDANEIPKRFEQKNFSHLPRYCFHSKPLTRFCKIFCAWYHYQGPLIHLLPLEICQYSLEWHIDNCERGSRAYMINGVLINLMI